MEVSLIERKLRELFALQKFVQNPRIDAMVRDAEARYGALLSDEDLGMVSAAGAPVPAATPERFSEKTVK